jgi:hypothetical protein
MTTKPIYDRARTGLLFVDPYNDFRSKDGRLWIDVPTLIIQGGDDQTCLLQGVAARGP